MRRDNHVVFVYLNGTPLDTEALCYQENDKLPKYADLTFERARLVKIGAKYLITLPIKVNDREIITADNIKNCIASLRDVILELRLTSFSIAKTELFDEILWSYVFGQLRSYLEDTDITMTIYKFLV